MSKPARWIITGVAFVVCEAVKTLLLYVNYPDVFFIVTHVLFDVVVIWSLVRYFVPLVKAVKDGPSKGVALLWLSTFLLDTSIIWFATVNFFETGRMPGYGLAAPALLMTWKMSIHENKEKA